MPSKLILENPPSKVVQTALGKPDSTFKLVDIDPITLKEGELHLKMLYLSNDPTQKVWITAGQDPSRTYAKPVQKGETVRSLGLAEVVESKSSQYVKGDAVVGLFTWSQEFVVHESQVQVKVADKSVPYPAYLSTIGLTGLTAYLGLKNAGEFKEGQSVLVSAASGATGSMVVQVAKHIFKASRVIGIAGSDEKCEWVKSLGADYCANYREEGWKEKLHDFIGKDYVDVYFDNVGGEILDFGLTHTKQFGHIVACGAIAGYNDPSLSRVSQWTQIVLNRLTARGFIVSDYADDFQAATEDILKHVKSGTIKDTEGAFVVDISGEKQPFEKVPEVWYRLFTEEKPRGKLLTKVA